MSENQPVVMPWSKVLRHQSCVVSGIAVGTFVTGPAPWQTFVLMALLGFAGAWIASRVEK